MRRWLLVGTLLAWAVAAPAQRPESGTGKVLKAHEGGIGALAISPDGTLAASASNDKLKFWSLPDFTVAGALQDMPAKIGCLAFSPDGKALAAGLGDGSIRVWSIPGRDLLTSWHAHGPLPQTGTLGLSFSSDGALLISAGRDKTAKVWSFPRGELLHTLEHPSEYVGENITAHGATLATAAGLHLDVYLWSLQDGKQIATLDGLYDLRSLAFLPDGKTLFVAGGKGGAPEFWSLADGRLTKRLEKHSDLVSGVAAFPHGRLVATVSGDQIRLWTWPERKLLATLPGNKLTFSADGKVLVTAGGKGARIWSLASPALTISDPPARRTTQGRRRTAPPAKKSPPPAAEPVLLRALEEMPEATKHIALDAKGETVAAASGKYVHLWSVRDGVRLATTDNERDVTALAFAPDGRTLFAATEGGALRLWAVPVGTPVATWTGHKQSIQGMAVSPDGRMLISASLDGTIRVWSLPDGKVLTALEAEVGFGNIPALSPDGKLLSLTGFSSSGVRLWTFPEGKLLPAPHGHTNYIQSLAMTPDGSMLVSASNTEIKLWSLPEGRLKSTVAYPGEEGVAKHRGVVAISRDGRFLASAESWETKVEKRGRETKETEYFVKLWELPDLRPITNLIHQDRVISLAFSPDSSLLVTGDQFGLIYRWDLGQMRIGRDGPGAGTRGRH